MSAPELIAWMEQVGAGVLAPTDDDHRWHCYIESQAISGCKADTLLGAVEAMRAAYIAGGGK